MVKWFEGCDRFALARSHKLYEVNKLYEEARFRLNYDPDNI